MKINIYKDSKGNKYKLNRLKGHVNIYKYDIFSRKTCLVFNKDNAPMDKMQTMLDDMADDNGWRFVCSADKDWSD